ncbi:MAG: hypothetical protein ACOC2C_04550 [Cyclonatronaceae bacterium]
MSRFLNILFFLPLVLWAVSCHTVDSGGPTPLTELRSDQATYAAGDSLRITITNFSEQSLFRDRNCHLNDDTEMLTLERLVGDEWVDPPPPDGCYAIYFPPVEIKPGESDEFRAFAISEPGTYRYRFPLYRGEGLQELLPRSSRVSNAFTVRPD